MSKIHQLSPHIVAKIAAGEVIERPAYAVKELVENAIDAHADEITVHVEDGGLRKIIVSDNGIGMDEKDLQECYKPHTTSKTASDASLIGIKTLGFRGEALASLSAVSHLVIKSKTKKQKIGYQIEVVHGKVIKVIPVGIPQGTIIYAENLFSEVPARKKFLKSTQTELRYITEVISHYALAYSSIHFVLTHNRRKILDFPKNQTGKERACLILGKQMSEFLIPINYGESVITIQGFLVKPQFHSFSTSKQYLFINSRKVSDRTISLSVKEAYGTMLDSHSHPIFILFLKIPYEMVDVNIHPRKEHIGITNSQGIFQIVKQSVLSSLSEHNISFQNLSWKTGVGTTKSYAGKLLKEIVLDKVVFKIENPDTLTQLHNMYILYGTKNGFVFIDQHAAHERILFEKLREELIKQTKKQKPYQLKDPYVLHISSQDRLLLQENKKMLLSFGFGLTEKGSTIILTHVPSLFQDRDPGEVIQNLLDSTEDNLPLPQIDKVSERMIAYLACRSAVKAGTVLDNNQMREIIRNLEKTPNNSTCPHGRPTHIFTSLSQLNHSFKR